MSLSKILNSANPQSTREIRALYRKIRSYVLAPEWIKCPNNIQIDTHNYCNLWQKGKGCIHCNVKPSSNWNLKRGFMTTHTIKNIIDYWGKHGCKSVAPYINGEPLLDNRLLQISTMAQNANMYVVIDTNGTLYDMREMLVHENNRQIRFSYSALTPEVYNVVHGAPLFKEATQTIEWFLKNRKPSQYPMIYFITNKHNMHELKPFVKKWRGKIHLTLYPLHEIGDLQPKSIENLPENIDYWENLTQQITGQYPKQPARPIDIYPDGTTKIRYFLRDHTCQGTHSFSVSWMGDLLHCTDISYEYNYGNVYDNDMLEIWHIRNFVKMIHPACQLCNVKHPKHYEILARYMPNMIEEILNDKKGV